METSGYLIFVIVILVGVLFYACVRKIADQLKQSLETWSRDHAAAEVIQLRSPRRAHLEVPEAVNYPSPVVAHSTNGFPTVMPNSSASIQMLGYEAAKIAKSKSRDNSPTIPESSLKPQPFQTCWKFDAK